MGVDISKNLLIFEGMKSIMLILALLYWPLASGAKVSTLKLDPKLKAHYLTLLRQAGDFHKVIAKGDQRGLRAEIKETQEIIAKLYKQILSVPQFHHQIHSHKLLKSIEEQLAIMHFNNSLNESGKKKNMKKLFNSFFELAQVYNLTEDMEDKILYCSKDRSLWFQKGGKAENPISPGYKNCGRSIL